MSDDDPPVGYSRWAVLVSALAGIGAALLSWWVASGFAVFYEGLFRVGPTVARESVGSDFVVGNSVGWLKWSITIVHFADVVMGIGILFMVFLHWASFRRLAGRMQHPDESATGGVATDGGTVAAQRDSTDSAREGGDGR